MQTSLIHICVGDTRQTEAAVCLPAVLLSVCVCVAGISLVQTGSRYSWLGAKIPATLSHMGWSLSCTNTHTEQESAYCMIAQALPPPSDLSLFLSPLPSFAPSHTRPPVNTNSQSAAERVSVQSYVRQIRGYRERERMYVCWNFHAFIHYLVSTNAPPSTALLFITAGS